MIPMTNDTPRPHIAVINGPNLNLTGIRQPGIYGTTGFDSYIPALRAAYPDVEITYFQSNVEGEIIDELHRVGFSASGIVLNAGGYTHTSVAIADAVAAITAPVVEVHISNVFSREEFRHISLLSSVARGTISGFGLDSYRLAVEALLAMPASVGNI